MSADEHGRYGTTRWSDDAIDVPDSALPHGMTAHDCGPWCSQWSSALTPPAVTGEGGKEEVVGERVTTLWAEIRTDADNAGEDAYAARSDLAREAATDAIDAALDVVAENLPALVAQARADGAAEERERVLGLIDAKAERFMGAVVVGMRMAADTIRDDSAT